MSVLSVQVIRQKMFLEVTSPPLEDKQRNRGNLEPAGVGEPNKDLF